MITIHTNIRTLTLNFTYNIKLQINRMLKNALTKRSYAKRNEIG